MSRQPTPLLCTARACAATRPYDLTALSRRSRPPPTQAPSSAAAATNTSDKINSSIRGGVGWCQCFCQYDLAYCSDATSRKVVCVLTSEPEGTHTLRICRSRRSQRSKKSSSGRDSLARPSPWIAHPSPTPRLVACAASGLAAGAQTVTSTDSFCVKVFLSVLTPTPLVMYVSDSSWEIFPLVST